MLVAGYKIANQTIIFKWVSYNKIHKNFLYNMCNCNWKFKMLMQKVTK